MRLVIGKMALTLFSQMGLDIYFIGSETLPSSCYIHSKLNK